MLDGKVVTNGGRVLCVTALGESIQEAQTKAYRIVQEAHGMACFIVVILVIAQSIVPDIMPELPEVETTCKALKPLLSQSVTSLTVRESKLRWPVNTRQLKRHLAGQPLLRVQRRAKYILMHFQRASW